eukprot:COSAG01_NODE_2820_length_7012_cov_5.502965_1_plen_222_part_00
MGIRAQQRATANFEMEALVSQPPSAAELPPSPRDRQLPELPPRRLGPGHAAPSPPAVQEEVPSSAGEPAQPLSAAHAHARDSRLIEKGALSSFLELFSAEGSDDSGILISRLTNHNTEEHRLFRTLVATQCGTEKEGDTLEYLIHELHQLHKVDLDRNGYIDRREFMEFWRARRGRRLWHRAILAAREQVRHAVQSASWPANQPAARSTAPPGYIAAACPS